MFKNLNCSSGLFNSDNLLINLLIKEYKNIVLKNFSVKNTKNFVLKNLSVKNFSVKKVLKNRVKKFVQKDFF